MPAPGHQESGSTARRAHEIGSAPAANSHSGIPVYDAFAIMARFTVILAKWPVRIDDNWPAWRLAIVASEELLSHRRRDRPGKGDA